MTIRILAYGDDGMNIPVYSPFIGALLNCIDAAYRSAPTVTVGSGLQTNSVASEFLTYMLAYPTDVITPVVTVRGSLDPMGPAQPSVVSGRDVVLASGGIDSTAALLHSLDLGQHPVAFWCDYGQPYAEPERTAVVDICQRLAVELVTLKIDLGSRIARDVKFGHVIPARNLLIAACAAALGAAHITLAGLADELIVPDKSLRMYSEAQAHLNVAVQSPFINMTKTDVLRVWDQRWTDRLDALSTVSCYRSDGDCQDCSACAKRAVALVASGYAVRPFPVFERQQRLILESWFPRFPNLPSVRRADLLIALGAIREVIPHPLVQALDGVGAGFLLEARNRLAEIAARADIS